MKKNYMRRQKLRNQTFLFNSLSSSNMSIVKPLNHRFFILINFHEMNRCINEKIEDVICGQPVSITKQDEKGHNLQKIEYQ